MEQEPKANPSLKNYLGQRKAEICQTHSQVSKMAQ